MEVADLKPLNLNGKAAKKNAMARPYNPSGIHPTEFNVVVLPDSAKDTIEHGSLKLYKPIAQIDKEQAAAVTGQLIAVSPLAFTYERWPDGAAPPKVGDRVSYQKYAGMQQDGKDGGKYVIMKDKDIAAILE